MTKKQFKKFNFIVLILLILAYGLVGGAKSSYYKSKYNDQIEENAKLNNDLKSFNSLILERDIKIREKDDTIQQLMSQNEGLIWQLQEEGDIDE